ncbi:MAG: ABC-2 transporter permease [Lachnospiraceae bacterium]|nr:ABC-2 transporter permease [Lachnospiraceae bacterium]
MRGLLKNDFLAVYTNAKVFSVFMFLFGIFCAAVTSQSLQMYYIVIGTVGFSMNTVAVLNNEYSSKWGKYKLTLPIKRADIVKSQFLNHLLWLLIGILFVGIELCLSWLLHGFPFEQSIDMLSVFALGISISLFMGAIFIPLFYLGGAEKSTVFLIISVLCAIGIDAVLVNITDASFLFGIVMMLVCSSLTFALSYPITVRIFRKREY